MNKYDIIVIAILAVCIALAVFFSYRRKKNGGCSCGGSCGNCQCCSMAQNCDKKV